MLARYFLNITSALHQKIFYTSIGPLLLLPHLMVPAWPRKTRYPCIHACKKYCHRKGQCSVAKCQLAFLIEGQNCHIWLDLCENKRMFLDRVSQASLFPPVSQLCHL